MSDILIIDDDKVDRESIKRSLKNLHRDGNLNIHEATTGEEGLNILHNKKFNCVFLDYQLPDMDGISFLRKLYDPEMDLAKAPIIMLTGQGSQSVMIDALRWGAQDYLLKDNISADTLNISIIKAKEIFELKIGRKQAQDQLHRRHKMEAIGQLTSGVAHDFNNLLTVILGNTRLLQKKITMDPQNLSPEDILRKAQAIESAANKGAELVKRLMIFTRQRSPQQVVANINKCIDETLEILKRTLGETIQTNTILNDNPWPVSLDIHQFENALINIAVNARDAMPKGGNLTIETNNVVLDKSYTLNHPDVTEGSYVLICISDTGKGMNSETLRRIFEPFFTTKPAGEGTGLGLSMVYGFIRQSGGHIHVYSEENHGTVFRIYLPKIVSQEDEKAAPANQALPMGKETVLVVEDNEEVRNLAMSMLERLGYKVLQAHNSRMALEIIKRDYKDIDLIFTDIVMPGGINGIELMRETQKYYPDIKVLYTSGYTQNAIPDYQLRSGEELISKPYHKETLAHKIRKVLDWKESMHA
jgi:signal transduction histidine kinase